MNDENQNSMQNQALSGKHYTSMQKIGITSEEDKLRMLLVHLAKYFHQHKSMFTDKYVEQEETDVYISRTELTDLINNALSKNSTSNLNRYTIYDYINLLRRRNFIKPMDGKNRRFAVIIWLIIPEREQIEAKISAFLATKEGEKYISLSNNTDMFHAEQKAVCEATASHDKKEIQVMQ